MNILLCGFVVSKVVSRSKTILRRHFGVLVDLVFCCRPAAAVGPSYFVLRSLIDLIMERIHSFIHLNLLNPELKDTGQLEPLSAVVVQSLKVTKQF